MKCQLCLEVNGEHKVQAEGLCGTHTEQIKELLDWYFANKDCLKGIDLMKVSQKFGTKTEPAE